MKIRRKTIRWALVVTVAIMLLPLLALADPTAGDPPHAALKYRRDLVRNAHYVWGLDAPVAVFAAQVQAESGWHPGATSEVGAQGMTQIMPETANWMRKTFPRLAAGDAQNPVWAMRAMVTYDKWLYAHVSGDSEYDRMWAALRAYNGGLGHWQAEAATVKPATDRIAIDSACGAVRRSEEFCPENVGYPQRILVVLQPRYLSWGRGVTL